MLTLPVKAGRDFQRVPPGVHVALCNILADAGLQPGSALYPKPKHKLFLRFEVPDQRIEYEHEGRKLEGPLCIGLWAVASMHAKAILRLRLEGWRGRKFTDEEAAAFDLETVLGKPCTLVVQDDTRNGKTYSNIVAIAPAPKGCTLKPENPLLFYGNDGDAAKLAALPPWLQARIKAQIQPEPEPEPERAGPDSGDGPDFDSGAHDAGGFQDDSDIPF